MVKRKRATDNPLIKRLKELGCTFCPTCFAYTWPDHTQHVAALAVDRHDSRYQIVGGYGAVRVVDLREESEAA